MSFMQLYDSYRRGELLMIDGAMCRWHLRKDGQITIYEIISSKKGNGTKILDFLKGIHGGKCIVAKCPDYLSANEWYKCKGFVLKDKEKNLNVWCLEL